jgi:hypothetical protein
MFQNPASYLMNCAPGGLSLTERIFTMFCFVSGLSQSCEKGQKERLKDYIFLHYSSAETCPIYDD